MSVDAGFAPISPENPGTMTATWIDPDGVEGPLTAPPELHGRFTRNGPAGWGAAPVTIVTDPDARGGEQVRHIRSNPRRITWPLHIFGDTHMQFVQRERSLIRAFTATKHRRRSGILRVARPDGSAREIDAVYEEGLEGQAGQGWVSSNPVITLFCPDGYWRDVDPVQVIREYTLVPLNANPYFPTDASNWTGSPGTVAWSTAQFHEGVASLLLTPDGVSSQAVARSEILPATAGVLYSARAWVRCAVARNVAINIDWLTAAGGLFSTSSAGFGVAANTWTLIQVIATAPANTGKMGLTISEGSTPPASHTLHIDEAMLILGSGVGVPFLSDYPRLSTSHVLGDTTVDNPGEVEAWPVWTITGPATSVTAINETTGQQFALTHALAGGNTITITTNRPMIRGPGGVNLVDALDWPSSELWPLLPGVNDVNFQVGGSGPGTRIVLEFHPRYESA